LQSFVLCSWISIAPLAGQMFVLIMFHIDFNVGFIDQNFNIIIVPIWQLLFPGFLLGSAAIFWKQYVHWELKKNFGELLKL
jgi:hypothetical protein